MSERPLEISIQGVKIQLSLEYCHMESGIFRYTLASLYKATEESLGLLTPLHLICCLLRSAASAASRNSITFKTLVIAAANYLAIFLKDYELFRFIV